MLSLCFSCWIFHKLQMKQHVLLVIELIKLCALPYLAFISFVQVHLSQHNSQHNKRESWIHFCCCRDLHCGWKNIVGKWKSIKSRFLNIIKEEFMRKKDQIIGKIEKCSRAPNMRKQSYIKVFCLNLLWSRQIYIKFWGQKKFFPFSQRWFSKRI